MFDSRYACLALALLMGCGEDEVLPDGTGAAGGECAGAECSASTCVDGFQPIADGAGCEPTLPEGSCPVGTARFIGETACQPVGHVACAAGFQADPTGWGCRDVLPGEPCTGATMEVLGETTCQPVGDCGAPFPPAEATHFVDATYLDAELDATHFRVIRDAMDAAAEGAVIAVETGVYAETLPTTRSVTLVGRCAEQVIIEDAGDQTFGIAGDMAPEVEVRGFTLRGHLGAAGSFTGTMTVDSCVIEANVVAGVIVSEPGSVLRLRDSVVRGTKSEGGAQARGVLVQNGGRVEIEGSVLAVNELANLVVTGSGSSARVSRSVLRDAFPQTSGSSAGLLGAGIYAIGGVQLDVQESAILDNTSGGIFVGANDGDPPSMASISGSVVRGTRWNEVSATGRGIEVSRASSLAVSNTTVALSEEYNLLVTEGSTATVEQTTLRGPIPDDGQPTGPGLLVAQAAYAELRDIAAVGNRIVGMQVQQEGTLIIADSLVADTLPALAAFDESGLLFGVGVTTVSPSSLEVRRSSLVGHRGAAALLPGAEIVATFDGVLFADTLPNERGEFGRGLTLQDGAQVDVLNSAVLDSVEAGVFMADPLTRLTMTDCSVLRTAKDGSDRHGLGFALTLGAYPTLNNTTIAYSEGAGIAAFSSSAFVQGGAFYANSVGVHPLGSTKVVEADQPSGDVDTLTISSDTRFVDNGARFGTGSLPTPNPITPPPAE